MEELIFNIIIDNVDQIGYFRSDMKVAAEEITAHVKEFIEWKDRNTWNSKHGETLVYLSNPPKHIMNPNNKCNWFTMKELFQYWWDKVKDK